VLVGHSQGGLHVQLYASRYPTEVVGLVLVDAAHPDGNRRQEALLTPAQRDERHRLLAQNAEGVTVAELDESHAQARAAGPLPDVPLVVLRHGLPDAYPAGWPADALEQLWRDLQTDLSHRTAHGTLVLADKSGHFIHRDQPQLVLDAVQSVVTAARGR
jgi:pimeloyl-ACP methyl ester carboxylesterase